MCKHMFLPQDATYASAAYVCRSVRLCVCHNS